MMAGQKELGYEECAPKPMLALELEQLHMAKFEALAGDQVAQTRLVQHIRGRCRLIDLPTAEVGLGGWLCAIADDEHTACCELGRVRAQRAENSLQQLGARVQR